MPDPVRGCAAHGRSRTLVVAATLVAVATACGDSTYGAKGPITDQGQHTANLLRGFLVVAALVAALVYGLILFVTIRYRRRDPDAIPSQIGDNLRVEVFYMVTPIIVVAGLFGATLLTQQSIDDDGRRADLVVRVTGFQWGWQFSYPDHDVEITGSGVEEPPVLVLPADRTTRLVLRTEDVIHSFWVPEFLSKRDLISGVDNSLTVTPRATGTYDGRCAEFCGLDHWRMTFVLKVVPPDRFERELTAAAAGGDS